MSRYSPTGLDSKNCTQLVLVFYQLLERWKSLRSDTAVFQQSMLMPLLESWKLHENVYVTSVHVINSRFVFSKKWCYLLLLHLRIIYEDEGKCVFQFIFSNVFRHNFLREIKLKYKFCKHVVLYFFNLIYYP